MTARYVEQELTLLHLAQLVHIGDAVRGMFAERRKLEAYIERISKAIG